MMLLFHLIIIVLLCIDIFFNKLNVKPKQIKFTADDEVFITSVKLTNSEEANTIITNIIEILRVYVNVQME